MADMSPQLATDAPDDLSKLKFPLAAEPKHDGCRLLAFVLAQEVCLVSRELKEFENFEELEAMFRDLPWGYVYDGEVVGHTSHGKPSFKALMKRAKAKRGKATDVKLKFHLFDMLTIEEWEKQECMLTWTMRLDRRMKVLTGKIPEIYKDMFSSVPFFLCNNLEELKHAMDYYHSQEMEGTMIKSPKSSYTFAKNVQWMKIKPVYTVDLQIVGFEEGNTKFHPVTGEEYINPINGKAEAIYPNGRCGAILLEGVDNGKKIATKCSGFTQALSLDLWENQAKYKGKVVEVEYQTITLADNSDIYSLQFPRFKRFRPDKETA